MPGSRRGGVCGPRVRFTGRPGSGPRGEGPRNAGVRPRSCRGPGARRRVRTPSPGVGRASPARAALAASARWVWPEDRAAAGRSRRARSPAAGSASSGSRQAARRAWRPPLEGQHLGPPAASPNRTTPGPERGPSGRVRRVRRGHTSQGYSRRPRARRVPLGPEQAGPAGGPGRARPPGPGRAAWPAARRPPGPGAGRGDLGGPCPLPDRRQEGRDRPPGRPRGGAAPRGRRSRQRLASRTSSAPRRRRNRGGRRHRPGGPRRPPRISARGPGVGRLPVRISQRMAPRAKTSAPLVEALDLAPCLLGAHVRGGAEDRPGLRRATPARSDAWRTASPGRARRLAGLTVGPIAAPWRAPWRGPSRPPAPRRRRRP